VKRGTGKITVNGKTIEEYFARPVLRLMIRQPLEAAKRETEVDIVCTVKGSGHTGQAGAVRHGIAARACRVRTRSARCDAPGQVPHARPARRRRKKYGKAGARRSFQFSKR
jgi:small subunit ribosomal protein S9